MHGVLWFVFQVLISGKEELDAEISPAMDAVLRVFKRVNGISESEGDGAGSASIGMCSVRLLVASSQAINIIGKQGSIIKSIQENTGASIRVLTGGMCQIFLLNVYLGCVCLPCNTYELNKNKFIP